MEDLVFEQMLAIVETLYSNPLFELFLHSSSWKDIPEYTKIIKNPMDLDTIKKKLKAKAYKSIDQWKFDVEIIFQNAKVFNKGLTLYVNLAIKCQEIFQNLYDNSKLVPKNKSKLEYSKLFKDLEALFSKAPSSIGSLFTERDAYKPEEMRDLNEDDDQKLISYVEKISKESELLKFHQILQYFNVTPENAPSSCLEFNIDKIPIECKRYLLSSIPSK